MKSSDFDQLEVITQELLLADKKNSDNSPVRVRVFRDRKSGHAYQVDFRNKEYREATHVLGNYSEWKKLTG